MEVSYLIARLLLIFSIKVLCNSNYTSNTTDVGEPLVFTDYIKRNETKMARELSKVHLLGWSGHSGYFTVNEKCLGKLFFWFIPAVKGHLDAPLFLWLNGGPGGSSMMAMFTEHGPYECREENQGPTLRNVTWSEEVNMLYVDQPIGTGFSSPKNSCLAENVSVSTEQLYVMLTQFFCVFPEYRKNDLYLTGQSFSGHYIPCLGAYIDRMNQRDDVEMMNLKGIMVGNPFISLECTNYADYVYNLGFVSALKRDEIHARHKEIVCLIHQKRYVDAVNKWTDNWEFIQTSASLPSFYNVGKYYDETSYHSTWLNENKTRRMLHVGNESFQSNNKDVYKMFMPEISQSFAHYVEILLKAKKYSVWFYSGNMDVSCLTTSTDCTLLGLDWWGAEGYRRANRTAWFHDGELAGHVQSYGPLALIMLKESGHSVPYYQPEVMYDLVKCKLQCPFENHLCSLNTTIP